MQVDTKLVTDAIFRSHPEFKTTVIPVDRDKVNLGIKAEDDFTPYCFKDLLYRTQDIMIIDPDVPNNAGYYSIIHESRPSRAATYRKLKFQREQLRFLRRKALSRLSKAAYAALVRKYSTRRTIRVWDRTYRETFVFSTTRGPDFQKPVVLSKRKFLELMLKQSSQLRKRVILAKAIKYLQEHPEKDVPAYKTVYVSDGFPIDQQALAQKRKVPNMVRKVITDHDWRAIRLAWVSLQVSVQTKLAELDEQIRRITDQIARVSISSCTLPLPSNRMVQEGVREVLPKPQRFCELTLGATWFGLSSAAFMSPAGYAFDVGALPVYQLYYPNRTYIVWQLPSDFVPKTTCEATYSAISEKGIPITQLPHAKMLNLESYSFRVTDNWIGDYLKYSSDPIPEIDEVHRQPGVAVPTDSPARYYTRQGPVDRDIAYATKVTNLDDGSVNEEAFNDAMLLNTNRLLALDVSEAKADRIVFNATRSLGELKDTPSSIRTIKELPAFAQRTLGARYYEVAGRNSRFLALPSSLYRGVPVGQLASSQRLQAQLGVSVVKKHLTKLSVVRHLAALYLCWKFGVSQTLSDAEIVLKKGVREVTKLRRGLGQLATHLNTSRVYHPIRRMWRLCSDSIRVAHKEHRSTIEESITSERQSVRFEDDIDYSVEIDRLMRGYTLTQQDVIKTGRSGLIYVNNSLLKPADRVSAETLKTIERHNDQLLLEKLGQGDSDVYIRNDARGVVYAWFSWRMILRALTDGMANLATKTKAFLTMWELAPVSFVTEWFSNIRTMVLSAQALLERTSAKISPVGKPWVMVSNRLWAGCAGGRRRAELRCCDQELATYAVTSFASAADRFHRAIAISQICVKRRYEWSLTAESPSRVTLYRTRIRRAVRCPAQVLGKVPEFRVGCSINAGKLSSLLAMFVSK